MGRHSLQIARTVLREHVFIRPSGNQIAAQFLMRGHEAAQQITTLKTPLAGSQRPYGLLSMVIPMESQKFFSPGGRLRG
jgi:hypothetical protein